MIFHDLIQLKKKKRKDKQATHLLLQKLHHLLDTVAHGGRVSFKHQLGRLRFLIIRIDARESCEAEGGNHICPNRTIFLINKT